jgi:hypothetical protein
MRTSKEKVIQLLKEDKVIPIIGAGVSTATANLPSWYNLIRLGFEYATDKNLEEDLIAIGEKHLVDNELLLASNILKKVLRAPKFPFSNWIKDCFDNPTIISDDLINSISDLSTPIILTTNYDTLLSTVNSYSNKQKYVHNQYEEVVNSIKKKEEIIVHLHGIYDLPETIILSNEDYENLNKNVGYKTLLQKLLTDYHFLFIGCSKDGVMDEDFLPIFNFIKEYFPNSSNQHFILLHEKEITSKNHIPLLTECNIEAIVYGDEYNQLGEFINTINPNFDKKELKLKKQSEVIKKEFDRVTSRTNNFVDNKIEVDDFFKSNFQNKYDWVNPEKLKILEEVLNNYNKTLTSKKEKLLFSQTIIQSVFNTSELKEKVDLWSKYGDTPDKLNPLNYISTALLAYDCLLKIPQELVHDIKLSNHSNVFHYGFYHGNLGNFVTEINGIKKRGVDLEKFYSGDRYLFENLKRIIQSLKNFLELDAESFYSEVENATINENIPKSFIVIVTDDSITLGNNNDTSIIYAKLPLNENFRISKIEVVSVSNTILIFGINSNTCFYWNPKEDIFMNTIYFSEKYQISDFIIDKEDNEIVVYLKVNSQIIVLKKFVEKKKIDLIENTGSTIKYSGGFLSLRRMDSAYKGDVFYKTDFSGKTSTLYTINSLVDEAKKNYNLNKLITDFVENDPLGNWRSIIEVKELYRIEKDEKEIIILRSSFVTDEASSILFIFEIIQGEIIHKKSIHLKYSVCFCLSYFITKQNDLQLACGYLNMDGNKVLCEVISMDINYKIISNKLFNKDIISEDFKTSDTFQCFFTDENTLILNIEGKKILTFSLDDDSKNKIQLLENINTIKFYNSIK